MKHEVALIETCRDEFLSFVHLSFKLPRLVEIHGVGMEKVHGVGMGDTTRSSFTGSFSHASSRGSTFLA